MFDSPRALIGDRLPQPRTPLQSLLVEIEAMLNYVELYGEDYVLQHRERWFLHAQIRSTTPTYISYDRVWFKGTLKG